MRKSAWYLLAAVLLSLVLLTGCLEEMEEINEMSRRIIEEALEYTPPQQTSAPKPTPSHVSTGNPMLTMLEYNNRGQYSRKYDRPVTVLEIALPAPSQASSGLYYISVPRIGAGLQGKLEPEPAAIEIRRCEGGFLGMLEPAADVADIADLLWASTDLANDILFVDPASWTGVPAFIVGSGTPGIGDLGTIWKSVGLTLDTIHGVATGNFMGAEHLIPAASGDKITFFFCQQDELAGPPDIHEVSARYIYVDTARLARTEMYVGSSDPALAGLGNTALGMFDSTDPSRGKAYETSFIDKWSQCTAPGVAAEALNQPASVRDAMLLYSLRKNLEVVTTQLAVNFGNSSYRPVLRYRSASGQIEQFSYEGFYKGATSSGDCNVQP